MSLIVVTGAAGFIGFHTSERLLNEGHTVVGIDNLNNYYSVKLKKSRLAILKKHPNFRFYKIDIGNYKKLATVFKKHKVDQICHLAAQAGVRYSLINPFVYLRSNIDGTLNIAECARQFKISSIVYASSSSVYGDTPKETFSEEDRVDTPISLYAATKKSDELIMHVYHHLFKINCIGLRFFTVYGPWGRPDMALFSFTENIIKNKPIALFNEGNMYRDFTYVDDIVQGIIAALNRVTTIGHAVINLGNNQPERLIDFVHILEHALNKKAVIELKPIQPGDVPRTCADITKANLLLNYQPQTSLNAGVPAFVGWYQKYYKI